MPYIVKYKDTWGGEREWEIMTVGEYIEVLKKFPPDVPMLQEYDSSWGSLGEPRLIDSPRVHKETGIPQGQLMLWINPRYEP
jgi:hypothetical protein